MCCKFSSVCKREPGGDCGPASACILCFLRFQYVEEFPQPQIGPLNSFGPCSALGKRGAAGRLSLSQEIGLFPGHPPTCLALLTSLM